MTTEKQVEWWLGFACKKCGAPLAVRRSDDPSKSGAMLKLAEEKGLSVWYEENPQSGRQTLVKSFRDSN